MQKPGKAPAENRGAGFPRRASRALQRRLPAGEPRTLARMERHGVRRPGMVFASGKLYAIFLRECGFYYTIEGGG